MTQTPQTPAGWYPANGVERWWDGNAWSEHTRPLPGTAPPAYGQPGQPYLPQQPVSSGHLVRNLLIVFGVLFLLFVGGCVALVAVVGTKVDSAVNDDTLGGPNNPLTITEGGAFEVAGFEYAAGWDIPDAPASGFVEIQNLKVTNHRGKADRLLVEIKLLNANAVVATTSCVAGEFDKIAEDTTVALDCTSTDPLPVAFDKITIQDAI